VPPEAVAVAAGCAVARAGARVIQAAVTRRLVRTRWLMIVRRAGARWVAITAAVSAEAVPAECCIRKLKRVKTLQSHEL